jgi:hypothetical protein
MVQAMYFSNNARCSLKKLLLVAALAIVGVITGCQDAKFPYLVSIQISPGTPSVAAGLTQQFAAQGTFSNGTTRDITSLVTWSSSTPSVATIAMGGLATALSQGSSTITASFTTPGGTVTGSTTLTVTAPAVTSIQVSPATPSLGVGLTEQFTAQATFANGTKGDITSQVTWSSSNSSVASITTGGLASAQSPGQSTISASFTQPGGTVSGSTTLTVTSNTLVSILISDSSVPPPQSVAGATLVAGTTRQFFAYGLYTDGHESNITGSVQWSVVSVNVATIDSLGRAKGLIPGTATITAKDPATGLTQSAALLVTNSALTAIVVSPTNQTIAPLTRLSYSAVGKFADGTTQEISVDATWTSTNTPVATMHSYIATGVSAGSTMIQASLGGVTGSASLNVSAASIVSIAFYAVPSTIGIAVGSNATLVPNATFSDGTIQNIRFSGTWSVTPSDGSIATVDQAGIVTGVAAGTATVTVQLGTVTQTETVNVQNVSSIAVTPATATIADGTATQFRAIATLADGTTQDLTSSASWSSTNATAAKVANGRLLGGFASGLAAGNSTIVAVFGGISGHASLTVTNATLSSIAITPTAPQSISLGRGVQYMATATFSDSTTQDLTSQVIWTSSDPTVAVVNLTGLATSTGAGSTMVKATANINGVTASDDKALIVTP